MGAPPSPPAGNELTQEELGALVRGIRRALRRGIARQGATLRDYRAADGGEGSMQAEFRVYGREGEAVRALRPPDREDARRRARDLVLPRLPGVGSALLQPRPWRDPPRPSGVHRPGTRLPSEGGAELAEMTADAPRARFDAGRAGVGLGLTLGLALIAFASGGYFPTEWAWGALVSLVVLAALLVLGTALRPSGLGLASLGGLAGLGAWTWLALLWSDDTSATVLEGQRALLYVSAFAALLAVVRRATVPLVLSATFTAIFLASGYGLLTRLFPERLGVYDPVATYRLAEPLTYWNALGVFAVMGALLALGFATRAQSLAARALSAATLPSSSRPCTSRSAAEPGSPARSASRSRVAVDPRRLQLLAGSVALAVPSALAVLLSSQADALTRTDAPLGRSGRRATTRRVPDPARGRLRAHRRALLARRAQDRAVPAGEARLRGRPRAGGGRVTPCRLHPLRGSRHARPQGLRLVHDDLPRESGEPQHEAALVLRELPSRALERRLA